MILYGTKPKIADTAPGCLYGLVKGQKGVQCCHMTQANRGGLPLKPPIFAICVSLYQTNQPSAILSKFTFQGMASVLCLRRHVHILIYIDCFPTDTTSIVYNMPGDSCVQAAWSYSRASLKVPCLGHISTAFRAPDHGCLCQLFPSPPAAPVGPLPLVTRM